MDPKQRIPLSIDALLEEVTAAAAAAAAEAELGRHSSPLMTTARVHFIPPSMPLVDARDARRRAGNYRASRRVCADGWCHYFDALSMEMEREAT